jgi:hypothetical protein
LKCEAAGGNRLFYEIERKGILKEVYQGAPPEESALFLHAGKKSSNREGCRASRVQAHLSLSLNLPFLVARQVPIDKKIVPCE